MDSGASFGDEVRNEAFAAYALSDGGTQLGPLSSSTLGVISAQIAGTVYENLDGSGLPSSGDIGIEGVTVQLYLDDGTDVGELDAGDTLVATVTTNPSGGYEFNGYDPDNYLVVETDLSGYSSIADIDTAVGDCALPSPENGCNVIGRIVLATDSSSLGNDFFDIQPASIGNFVWDDLDGDRIQGGGEPGLESVTVELFNGLDVSQGTDTTDSSGNYSFTGLNPGDYYVVFRLLSGYVFSPQNQGGDDALDSDADPSTGRTSTTTLTSSEDDDTLDAGMYQPG